jgi:hypothetical protein
LDRVILYGYGVFFMDDISNMKYELNVKDQVVVAIYALLIFYSLRIGMSNHLGVSMFGFFCMWFNLKMFDVYAFKKKYAQK